MARFFGFKEKRSDTDHISSHLDNGGNDEISGLSQLYCPERNSAAHIRDIADILHEMEVIDAEQLSKIRSEHEKRADCDLCQIIAELNFADKTQISQARAGLYGL